MHFAAILERTKRTGPLIKPGNHVSRNFAVLSVGQMASRMLAFVTTIHLAQALLPERFGAVTFATGVLLYAGLLVDFGFDAYGPIEVSRGTSPLNKLVGTVLTFRSMLILPAFAVLIAFTLLAPLTPITRSMIQLYGLSLVANAADLGWVFLGGKQMWPSVVSEIITQVTIALGAYTLIHSPENALMMPIFFLIGRVLSVTFLIGTFIKMNGLPKLGIDWVFLKQLLRNAIPLCGSQTMAMISNNFDLLVVGIWLGTAGAGLYGAATRVVWVPTTLTIAYYTALRPLVAKAYIDGFDKVERTFKRSVRITTALAFGIATGGTLLAYPIMTQVFGKDYATAAPAFIILLLAFCLMLISRNYRLVLVSFNQQVVDLRIMTLAAATNIGLNLLLIKPFGITGAACATLVSESLILVCDYASTRRLISHVPLGRYIWRPLICCAIMSGVLVAIAPFGTLWMKVVLGGLVYAAAMIIFRVIRKDEIRSCIETVFPSRKIVQEEKSSAPIEEIEISRSLSSAAIGSEE